MRRLDAIDRSPDGRCTRYARFAAATVLDRACRSATCPRGRRSRVSEERWDGLWPAAPGGSMSTSAGGGGLATHQGTPTPRQQLSDYAVAAVSASLPAHFVPAFLLAHVRC